MSRLPSSDFVERINVTIDLLKESTSNEDVIITLIKRYQVSRRQAYRYLQAAQKSSSKLAIPERKVVFTVKLPVSTLSRFRRFASITGESLSGLVTRALESFLKRGRHG